MALSDPPETELESAMRGPSPQNITDGAALPGGSTDLCRAEVSAHPPLKAGAGLDVAALQARLDELNAKIDGLTEDRLERERLSDRLAAVEFTLLTVLSPEGVSVGDGQDAPLQNALDPSMLQALQSAEDRIMASLQGAVAQMGLSPRLEGNEKTVDALPDPMAAGSDVVDLLARLDQKLDRFAHQPAPVLDLTAQRQSFAKFLTSVGSIVARLETSINHLARQSAETATSDRLAAMESLLAAIPGQIATILVKQPDLTPQIAELAARVEQLSAAVDALANRPLPSPDMTLQRESFARFATSVSQVIARLEGVADKLTASPDPKLPAGLPDRLTPIEGQRSESPDLRDPLSQAILTLAEQIKKHGLTTAVLHPPSQSGLQSALYRPDQDEFFQDMRFVFAELIATQMKASKAEEIAAA